MPGQHEKKAAECASWWSFKLNEGEKHHSWMGMAVALFLSFFSVSLSFFYQHNNVKFLIRQKETWKQILWATPRAERLHGKVALTLPCHDFAHGLVFLKCISLIVEAASSRQCRQAKQIIPAMNLLLLLLLSSPLGQFSHSALSTDSRL